MIKEGNLVLIKETARRCSAKRGKTGKVTRIRYTNGPAEPIYFVTFSDNKTEIFRSSELEKISE